MCHVKLLYRGSISDRQTVMDNDGSRPVPFLTSCTEYPISHTPYSTSQTAYPMSHTQSLPTPYPIPHTISYTACTMHRTPYPTSHIPYTVAHNPRPLFLLRGSAHTPHQPELRPPIPCPAAPAPGRVRGKKLCGKGGWGLRHRSKQIRQQTPSMHRWCLVMVAVLSFVMEGVGCLQLSTPWPIGTARSAVPPTAWNFGIDDCCHFVEVLLHMATGMRFAPGC